MQLVQDGGFARGIQPKHHDLKLSITKTKSTRRYKKAVREHQPNSGNKNLRKKIQPYPHLAGAEEGIEQLAERLPHPRAEIHFPHHAQKSTPLALQAPNFRSDFVASSFSKSPELMKAGEVLDSWSLRSSFPEGQN